MQNLVEGQTRITKGRDGWKAETMFENEATGDAVQLSTWKRNKGIGTHYQFGKHKAAGVTGFSSFQFVMFQDESGYILNDPLARCTEKSITELHRRSLAAFREDRAAMIAKPTVQEATTAMTEQVDAGIVHFC